MKRKSSCLVFSLFLLSSLKDVPSIPFQEKGKEVLWTLNGLKWSDFQEVDIIPGSSNAIGRTTTKLFYTVTDSILKRDALTLRLIKVYSVMLPSKSFIKKDGNRKGLLEHEQIHFDIAEVEARKFRRELSEKVFNKDQLNHTIQRLHRKHVSNIGIINSQYDKHHLNPFIGHMQWRNDLNKELNDLRNYTLIDVWIKLNIN